MSRHDDTADVKALLIGQIDRLAAELAPDGRRAGKYWIARNPTRADNNIGSFYVHVAGAKPGAWVDAATGDKGDVFGFVQYIQRLPDFKSTIAWCRDWLKLPAMSVDERARRVAKARQFVSEQSGPDDAEKIRRAFGMFVAAKKRKFIGTPADLYLKGRAIDVSALDRVPGCLGFLPDAWCAETKSKMPAMVVCFTSPPGEVVAVHRTYLAKVNGQWDKAPLADPRKIWPSFRHAAMRLWRGQSKLDVKAAIENGVRETLVLTEGVEDGLSVALARPDLRVWAVGSLGNLAAFEVPPCVDDIIVCADNDWGKVQAQRQLGRALEALIGQGVTVSTASAHTGKDVNDQLRGRAA